MCMIRNNDENCDRFVYPIHILNNMETVDLSNDEYDDYEEVIQYWDDWNFYPYNLLPSTDEEEPARGSIVHEEDNNEEVHNTDSSNAHDLSNGTNQNANIPSASGNTSETSTTDPASLIREIELDVPQILLSMARISYHLNNQRLTFHD